jgi:hypothetical protein
VRALGGDHGHGGTADIAGANATDGCGHGERENGKADSGKSVVRGKPRWRRCVRQRLHKAATTNHCLICKKQNAREANVPPARF